MSWRAKAAAIVARGAGDEPTKPTKPAISVNEGGFVSFVSAHTPLLSPTAGGAQEAATGSLAAEAALPQGAIADAAQARTVRALAYLDEHPEVKRACFADAKADPENIVLTVAVREPWGAVEVLVRRDRFDAFALMELSARWPDTSLFVPEH